jgi:preprotein translocase subunit SecF
MTLSRRERREQRWKLLKQKRLEELDAAENARPVFHKKERKGFMRIYDKYYLRLLIIPAIILILSLVQVGYHIATTGDFINKGVSLSGGITVTVPVDKPVNIDEIQAYLKERLPGDEIDVRSAAELGVQKAIIITTGNVNSGKTILSALDQKIQGASTRASTETTGPALGGSFFAETTKAMLFAFVFMGLVVFFAFRTFTPSIMVISCVFADIVETIAAVNLFGMKISAAGIAAFLMLIGYSVDTDILLTSRVLRGKEGSVFDRTVSAAKTGILMTVTTLLAVTISLIMTQNETIKEIMTIMLIGLILDIFNTWITNTALLRYYVERIKPKRQAAAVSKAEKKAMRHGREKEKEDFYESDDSDAETGSKKLKLNGARGSQPSDREGTDYETSESEEQTERQEERK